MASCALLDFMFAPIRLLIAADSFLGSLTPLRTKISRAIRAWS
jgi:hypothetical protein